MTYLEMRHRLLDRGMKNTDLIRQIEAKYHEKLTGPELDYIMKGKRHGPKAEKVKQEVEEILSAE